MERQLSPNSRLILGSLVFGVLWTASMYWWNRPSEVAGTIILMLVGALATLGWYGGMRLYLMRLRRPT